MLPKTDLATMSSDEVSAALGVFLAAHAQSTAFLKPRGPYTLAEKEAFVNQLMTTLGTEDGTPVRNRWTAEAVTSALQCLRILAREVEGCEVIYSASGIKLLLTYAGAENSTISDVSIGPQQTEALKCLVNCCLSSESRTIFLSLGGLDIIISHLRGVESLDIWFLGLRILFLLTAQSPATLEKLEQDHELPELIQHVLDPISNKLLNMPSLSTGFANELMVVNEAFKVIFNAMMDNNTLGSSALKILPYQAGLGLIKPDQLLLDGQLADEVLPPILLVLRDLVREDSGVHQLAKTSTLVNYVGYGNAAGFLFQKGLLGGATPGSGGGENFQAGSGDPNIDPITGEISKQERNAEWDNLTEEEKEAETTKLIDIFEKLEKTGIIKKEQTETHEKVEESGLQLRENYEAITAKTRAGTAKEKKKGNDRCTGIDENEGRREKVKALQASYRGPGPGST
ncbi:Synembryn-A [Dinochytrium kinnereticum]|nr:Synembryn-A [Dinochytrium kinnereticum]